jgi:predicted enzyme related to lactoylglutathione lyase
MAGFRLANVRLFAMPEDWPAAWDFYANTLGLTVTSLNLDAGIVVFQAGEITLCVERVDESERRLVGRETGIGFRVESAHAACAFLESRNVEITGRPEKQSWGGILMHVKDPAGNVIDLAEYPK